MPFFWSAFLYFGFMLRTGKTQRMLQIFDKSLEFEWKIFEIFIILFSFFYTSRVQAWLFISNGKSILKFIFFLSFIINLKVEFGQPAGPSSSPTL